MGKDCVLHVFKLCVSDRIHQHRKHPVRVSLYGGLNSSPPPPVLSVMNPFVKEMEDFRKQATDFEIAYIS